MPPRAPRGRRRGSKWFPGGSPRGPARRPRSPKEALRGAPEVQKKPQQGSHEASEEPLVVVVAVAVS
eukprot:587196-Pyramimonas_sp.AAC.1